MALLQRLRNPTTIVLLFLTAYSTLYAIDDVPRHHWAWPSIKKLVAAGFIQSGASFSSFNGDRHMDRYQMALWIDKLLEYHQREVAFKHRELHSTIKHFSESITTIRSEIRKRRAEPNATLVSSEESVGK